VPRTFDCPKCGAPVEFSTDPTQTLRCNYCNSALAEPSLGRPAQVIQLKIDTSKANFKFPKWILLLLLIPVFGIVAGFISAIAGFAPLFFTPNKNAVNSRGNTSTTKARGGTLTEPAFGNVLLKFGSDGIGPGMFKDARSIAVDGAGNIYVGEYSGGRIQVFDADGKFLTQWMGNTKMPLRGLAADRKGNVYLVQAGKVQKYEGQTGKPIGELAYGGGSGFDDVATTIDGGLVCAWFRSSDDIVRFDAHGNVVKTIKAAISSVTDHSELDTRVAVDGLGNIYALGTFNNCIFKFSPEGKYLNKFSSDGDQPGQLRAPMAIAADGKGRVYVADIKGIQIFDGEGRYIRTFKPDSGHASGMMFNDKNELLIVDRTKVVKLALAE
jgi:sugar lactone lactonase YvrE